MAQAVMARFFPLACLSLSSYRAFRVEGAGGKHVTIDGATYLSQSDTNEGGLELQARSKRSPGSNSVVPLSNLFLATNQVVGHPHAKTFRGAQPFTKPWTYSSRYGKPILAQKDTPGGFIAFPGEDDDEPSLSLLQRFRRRLASRRKTIRRDVEPRASTHSELMQQFSIGDNVTSLYDGEDWTPEPLRRGDNGTVMGFSPDGERIDVDFGHVRGNLHPQFLHRDGLDAPKRNLQWLRHRLGVARRSATRNRGKSREDNLQALNELVSLSLLASQKEEKKGQEALKSLQNFSLKPKEVANYLDEYVIKQKDAKKVLAVAICNHYNHCRRHLDGVYDENFNYAKPNILLVGPTGVGKTFLMRTIASLIGVPFVKADATKFSETGIVGKDVEDLVRELVDQAGGDTNVAQYGIIYVDEVDKIAEGGAPTETARVGQGRKGVQSNLLKILEDTEVDIDSPGRMNMLSQLGGKSSGRISTRNILFVLSGAFTGLDAELKSKKAEKAFGFAVPTSAEASEAEAARSYLRDAKTEDFVKAGVEAELIGRIPVRVALDALSANDLKQILTSSKGSVLKQFVDNFKGYSIDMTVSDAALTEIASLAAAEETGARGLVTVLERTLREHNFELPSSSIRSFELDNSTVANPSEALARLINEQA